jgi:hypothetical protein
MKSIETICMQSLNVGDSFFTTKDDKNITATASTYGMKVSTERGVFLTLRDKVVIELTKVTILEKS